MPALLGSELAEPDCSPVRLRIMSEDLLAFRDSEGAVGIVEPYCPHKLAPLYYGRNEDCGLRCTYHGWKFDVKGNCVDMPNNDPGSNYKDNLKIKSYPTEEWGGLIWVYMGPADKIPEMPQFEWARVPEDYRHVSRWLHRTNWCQGLEGEFDNSHVSFLHSYMDWTDFPDYIQPVLETCSKDGAPKFGVKETEYGMATAARRKGLEKDNYWMMAQWMMPTYSLVGNPGWPQGGRIWVPIDDYTTTAFGITYNAYEPLPTQVRAQVDSGMVFPPRSDYQQHKTPDGYIIDTFVPMANRENDYLMDRDMQRKVNFSGIWGVNDQDRSVQEAMPSVPGAPNGGLVDRRGEHLLASDLPTVTIRRRLMKLAKQLAAGEEPDLPAYNGDAYRIRTPGSRESEIDEFENLYEKVFKTEGVAEV
jgi:phenylpropionate dioxygenase-like ring-hydroxylating dioxygenase large terminal subunit